jgi:hypothetical protein
MVDIGKVNGGYKATNIIGALTCFDRMVDDYEH